jgi:hypothetical protein
MLRLIRIDKQDGMQAVVNAYFKRMEDWKSLEDKVQWHTLHTDLQWKCIMECYCASVNDPSNPLLTMLEGLCLAMHRAPKVGSEISVLALALEKGIVELRWQDYLPRVPGQLRRTPNPKNKDIFSQFLDNFEGSPKARGAFKLKIMVGDKIDTLGSCPSLRLMVARMHLYVREISEAQSLLLSLDLPLAGTRRRPRRSRRKSRRKSWRRLRRRTRRRLRRRLRRRSQRRPRRVKTQG